MCPQTPKRVAICGKIVMRRIVPTTAAAIIAMTNLMSVCLMSKITIMATKNMATAPKSTILASAAMQAAENPRKARRLLKVKSEGVKGGRAGKYKRQPLRIQRAEKVTPPMFIQLREPLMLTPKKAVRKSSATANTAIYGRSVRATF